MLKGNKGEWSELYTFFKLLYEGRLYSADASLTPSNIYYSIVAIIRSDRENIEYRRTSAIEIYDAQNNLLTTKTFDEMLQVANAILHATNTATETTYQIPSIEPILQEMNILNVKAKNTDKRDITLKIYDAVISDVIELGFSIKSQLGRAATLLNASKSTNVIYKLKNSLSDSDLTSLNNKSSIKDKLQYIYSIGNSIEYTDFTSDIFKHNLSMIDYSLPELYAELTKYYFLEQDIHGKKLNKDLVSLVEAVSRANPLNIKHEIPNFYAYKYKELLTNITLGFVPATLWSGSYDATGGYIIVKRNGDIICYHQYNRNEFRNYLFSNTKLDSPSKSRHGYGNFYNSNCNTYINLNSQIRYNH